MSNVGCSISDLFNLGFFNSEVEMLNAEWVLFIKKS